MKIINKQDLKIYLPSIFKDASLFAGFTTKYGGYSKGEFFSLNLALHVEDECKRVLDNREKLCHAFNLDFEKLTTCQQVHGNKVALVTKDNMGRGNRDLVDTIKDVDALITKEKDIPLMLFFADCTPIMLYDKKNNAIGLIHSGWKGTVVNIVKETISEMTKKFTTNPSDILACIGPSIGSCCYKIYGELLNKVKEKMLVDEDYKAICRNEKEDFYLDLQKYNELNLIKAGVSPQNIEILKVCTSCNSDFYSYRRDGGSCGRFSAFMVIK